MILVPLPYTGILPSVGLRFATPPPNGNTFYAFTLVPTDTRERINVYTLVKRKVSSPSWRHHVDSAFGTAPESFLLLADMTFAEDWSEWGILPTNMGSFGRLVRIEGFSY